MHNHNIGDTNVERLLQAGYQPEAIDPMFAQKLEAKLCEQAARQLASRLATVRRRLGWAMAMAASVAACFLVYYARTHHVEIAVQPLSPEIIQRNDTQVMGMTASPRAAVAAIVPATVGSTLATDTRSRRRVTLIDGSVLYLNHNTQVNVAGRRQIDLREGEIYLEVAPRQDGQESATFLVNTPNGDVTALGTHFGVRADPEGPGVFVTQGKVKVTGIKEEVGAGQQLALRQKIVTNAPRAAQVLDWTRELMMAAQSPLVPASQYGGGALVAIDPNGQEVKLELRDFHVDVHIEDGFARTTIDQTYFNNEYGRLEGTFYFPLPPDASLSRLAMYVEDGADSKLMEGGMAERDHARDVFETIRYQRRDPALLEWVDGSTFKMRVFPLEGRKEKRILLSYTQSLPSLDGVSHYRFPAGHHSELVRDWSFKARIKNANNALQSDSHPEMKFTRDGSDLVAEASAQNVQPSWDVTLTIKGGDTKEVAGFTSFEHEGQRYLMLEYGPDLPAQTKRERRDWVILFETSANRDPLLARAQIEVVKHLLENVEHDDTFAIVTANTRTDVFDTRLRPARADFIEPALKYLEECHLIGALDLSQGLKAAQPLLAFAKNPFLVHVGAGIPAMGEQAEGELVKLLGAKVRYVGIGVGKRWNRSFMKLAAERTGGYFTQINPDESIAWRAFDLLATLNTPRLLDVRVTDPAGKVHFLMETTMLAQGEELRAFMRTSGALPEKVVISGKSDGKEFTKTLAVAKVTNSAGYLPRTWAKLEIDRLLTEDSERNKRAIIALSKAMYVMSPFTSLLVLETDQDYVTYKVDRGRKDHWAMYETPPRIPTVYEPGGSSVAKTRSAVKNAGTPAETVLDSILMRIPPSFWVAPGTKQNPHGTVMTAREYLQLPVTPGTVDESLAVVTGGSLHSRSDRMRVLALMPAISSAVITPAERTSNRRPRPAYEAAPTAYEAARQLLRKRTISDDDQRSLRLKATQEWNSRAADVAAPRLPITAESLEQLGVVVIRTNNPADMNATLKVIEEMKAPFGGGAGGSFFRRGRIASVEDRSQKLTSDTSLMLQPINGRQVTTDSKQVMGRISPDQLLSDEFKRWITKGFTGLELIYKQQKRELNTTFFGDLTAFAPGLHTTLADIRATLETEEKPSALGTIPDKARKLIDRARSAGWQALNLPGEGRSPGFTLTFNGSGQFTYERVLDSGLHETVFCNGTTLWTLYPEIGLAGRRTFSRFHHELLSELVPWFVPSADDLARGANLKLINETTVAVIPTGPPQLDEAGNKIPTLEVHLVFANDGRFAERRYVDMLSQKVVSWVVYAADGAVTTLNPTDNKLLGRIQAKLIPAKAPSLSPDTKGLLVMELPIRSVGYRYAQVVAQTAMHGKPTAELWEQLFISNALSGDGRKCWLGFGERILGERDPRLGFFVLFNLTDAPTDFKMRDRKSDGRLSEAELPESLKTDLKKLDRNQDGLIDLEEYKAYWRDRLEIKFPGNAVASYLGDYLRPRDKRFDDPPVPEDLPGAHNGFIQQLAQFRNRLGYWRAGTFWESERGEQAGKMLRFLNQTTSPFFAWVVLDSMVGSPYYSTWLFLSSTPDNQVAIPYDFQKTIGKVERELGDPLGISYSARYEHAKALLSDKKQSEAANEFKENYLNAFKKGAVPPIDGYFVNALTDSNQSRADLRGFMHERFTEAFKRDRIYTAALLAWQMSRLSQGSLADELFNRLLAYATPESQTAIRLITLEYLLEANSDRAAVVLEELLKDPVVARNATAWRIRLSLAQKRGLVSQVATSLEKALDLEYGNLPDVVNLEIVCEDYRSLLTYYQQLAPALVGYEQPAQKLLPKVVRAADRWRALDPENEEVCQLAGRILRTLGAKELAWDYLTTPIGMKPREAAPWLGLAETLQREGAFDLAESAYVQAFAAEPTNAELLWKRAQNLETLNRFDLAQPLYRQIVDGTWQPRFQPIQQQARWRLAR